ncbi:MAG: hypothetical protein ABI353_05270, partial [Isosphaeraceae bacterium]
MSRKPPRLWRFIRVRVRRGFRKLDRDPPEWLAWLTPWGTSLTLHAAALLAFGLFYYVSTGDHQPRQGRRLQSVILSAVPGEDMPGQEEESSDPGKAFTTLEAEGLDPLAPKEDAPSILSVSTLRPSAELRQGLERLAPKPGSGKLYVHGGDGVVALARTRELTAPFQGRTGAARSRLARQGGATTQSERSVGLGLLWLARH